MSNRQPPFHAVLSSQMRRVSLVNWANDVGQRYIGQAYDWAEWESFYLIIVFAD